MIQGFRSLQRLLRKEKKHGKGEFRKSREENSLRLSL